MKFNLIEKSDKYGYRVYLSEDGLIKNFASKDANYTVNLETGRTYTWGRTLEEDVKVFPAPCILDLENTDICEGVNGVPCKFCYKSNTPYNEGNLSFENFKKMFDILPKSIVQIAFGTDSHATSNPDTFKMMEYARQHHVIPNVTVAEITEETADKIASLCGACAVSRYNYKDACYNSIKMLTDRGMTQINMHYMIAEETYDACLETIEDIRTDPRLTKLKSIVFLSLKQKGRGTNFHPLSQDKFDNIIKLCREYKISMGFDSCSALKTFKAMKDDFENVSEYIIGCESSLESSYINYKGMYYPCSFCEGEKSGELDWTKGINVLDCKDSEDFLDKVWYNPNTVHFRECLIKTKDDNEFKCQHCPMFNV